MYHPPSKRKQLIQRVAIYGLMSVTVVVLVTTLVFVMLGYRFDKADGRIEQGGLVQFDTVPGGAAIKIDGNDFSAQTPSKTTLASGTHYITMGRSGYKQWQKTVSLDAGSVLWLNYARLIPNELTPQNVANFASLGSTVSSPDDKWMALVADPKSAVITLADLSRDTIEPKNITLPTASYTKPSAKKTQSFTLDSWDPTSRYLLVKHVYDGKKTEWLVVDTGDVANTKNVTTLLDINASRLEFSNSDSRVLYAQIGGDVRKIDLGDATMSRPLVRNVAEFDLYDRSTITFVTKPDEKTKQRTVGYYNDGATKARTLGAFDNPKLPLHLTVGRYFGDAYVSIAYGDDLAISEGDLPRSDSSDTSSLHNVATVTIPGGAEYLSSKTHGRFIVAQHDATYTVYDLELKKMTTTALKGDAKVTTELHWIDGYMPWSDRDGILRLYEFDGANQHEIMQVASGFSATLSPSGKYLYGVSKDKDGYHLTRVRLIL